jgi:hypothetical protein
LVAPFIGGESWRRVHDALGRISTPVLLWAGVHGDGAWRCDAGS